MTPVDQEFLHDPENGQWGDCMRACVASLLDLPIEHVPHFFEGGCSHEEFDRRVTEFLEPRGLMKITLPLTWSRQTVQRQQCYHLIYGRTVRGTFHAVVGLNGLVVHDPHPSKAGIIEGAETQHAFLVQTGFGAHIKATQGGKEGAS